MLGCWDRYSVYDTAVWKLFCSSRVQFQCQIFQVYVCLVEQKQTLYRHNPKLCLLSDSIFTFLMCVGVCLHVCMKVSNPLELESQTLVSCHVVMGIEPGSCGRAVSVLNL